MFDEYIYDNKTNAFIGEFKAYTQFFGITQTIAASQSGIPLGTPKNLYAYDPSSLSGTDLAIVNAGGSFDTNPLTPVVVFADQIAASTFLTKNSDLTLSTTTGDNNTTGKFQGIVGNNNSNTGDEIKTNFHAVSGDSGGVATVVAGKNKTTYAVGILSSSDLNNSNARFTTITTQAYDEASANLGGAIDPSQMPTDLIYGSLPNEQIRGSVRKADIITNGDNDVILAGSGGGLINTGVGQNDVVFMHGANGQADPGTAVVVNPGTTTLVGGGANDKLVLLTDRLEPASGATTPSPSDTSDTVQLLGGYSYYPNSTDPSVSKIYQFSTSIYDDTGSTIVGNNGLYAYNAFYKLSGNDLSIIVSTIDLTGAIDWNGSVTIENYKPGDFGINLTDGPGGDNSKPAFENATNIADQGLTASSTPSQYVNDDSNVVWDGQKPYKYGPQPYGDGYPNNTVKDSDIPSDLAAVIGDTQGSGTPIVEPAPPTSPPTNTPIALAAGATLTEADPNETVNASGAGSTINFGNTGETASISDGTVSLWNNASATVTGTGDTITLNANGTLNLTGTGDTINVAAAGNVISASSATLNLWNNAGASVTGNSDVIALNASDTLTVSGTSDKVTVASTGNSVSITAGEVDLWNNAAASVTGNGNTLVVNASGTLSASGANTALTINGSGNIVTLTGAGDTVTVGGTSNAVTAAGASVSFFNASGGTVSGNGDTLTLYNSVTATASGTSDVVNMAGTHDALTMTGGAVNLWNNSSGTVTGNNDSVTLNNGGAATVNGTGTRLTIQGTGDTVTASSAQVGLVANSSATVTGTGDTFNFYGASTLAASGNTDSFVYTAAPASSTISGYNSTDQMSFDHTTFATWQNLLSHASQVGADTLIHTDTTHTITLQAVALTTLKQSNFHFT